jgi:UDP-N-acetylmuramate dehydrogenase
MKIHKNFSLKELNTFGVDAKAKFFVELKDADQIKEFLGMADYKKMKRLVIGGGSNLLFTQDFDGVVIKIKNKGISVEKTEDSTVYIKAAAGEMWDDLVQYCIEHNLGGIENLVMIPGNVGSSPIQNIGAYGVELKDVFHELEAMNVQTLKLEKFNKDDCKFAYRNSIFKNELKDKYIVLTVTIKVLTNPIEFNLNYGSIDKELSRVNAYDMNVGVVAEAVKTIRRRKLPDPAVMGNAGSFFKNPVITVKKFESLKITHSPELPGYVSSTSDVKIPAAWLIERAGWKGKKVGTVGVHKNQPLVIVNLGNATGAEILSLSEEIKESVLEKFGIELETEVNIL